MRFVDQDRVLYCCVVAYILIPYNVLVMEKIKKTKNKDMYHVVCYKKNLGYSPTTFNIIEKNFYFTPPPH